MKTSWNINSEKTQKPQRSVLLVFISTMFLQSNVDSCKYFWKTQHIKMSVFAFVLLTKNFSHLTCFLHTFCRVKMSFSFFMVIVCERINVFCNAPSLLAGHISSMFCTWRKYFFFVLSRCPFWLHWNLYYITCNNILYCYTNFC